MEKSCMNKKVLVGFVLGLMIMNFMVGVVSAGTVVSDLLEKLPGIDALDESFLGGGLKIGDNVWVVRILVFVLVALIIYSVVGIMPLVKDNDWTKIGVTLIVSFFATFYLSKDELVTMLFSYNALGIILTSIIPFIVITAVSKKLYEEGGTYAIFSKVLWAGFVIVLGFRWLFADTTQMGAFGKIVYPIILLAGLFMFGWEKKIFHMTFKKGLELRKSLAKRKMEEVEAGEEIREEKAKRELRDAGSNIGFKKKYS